MRVCKFGGTSMADAASIKRVINIIRRDEGRKYIVVSAPGKRDKSDVKITDALYACHDAIDDNDFDSAFAPIEERFEQICGDLAPKADIASVLDDVRRGILSERSRDFTASRGEYLSAYVLSSALQVPFVDSAELIKFDSDGALLLDESLALIKSRLKDIPRAVLPGFYGSLPDGRIKTFSRGGSDISGAIVASAVGADVYENWTDVNGFLSADPRVVKSPRPIDWLSYNEMRELSYMGAEVLHPEAIFPVRRAGIPIHIKNTFDPSAPGTVIVSNVRHMGDANVITGIAGKKGFSIINIEKEMMNSEIGFGRKVLSVFEDEGICFEHMPSGIDTLSVVVRDEYLEGKLPALLSSLWRATNADAIDVQSGLSLIATVGHNMTSRQGTAAGIFKALAGRHINVRMIDQGSSELNVIVGVDTFDYEKAIRAIYDHFFCAD